ncbi:hypothetical protein C447_12390 [Halococcus hamelinensis 100A6]|uniref:Uncharacterized protein n=1 Tax=Halococcus hamelinensis 100A6 TaxID=1132509 RepID=M0LW08_9EURY|nr:hypothetical protein C447_12390 [Halococcus hamelinensis 100A6]
MTFLSVVVLLYSFLIAGQLLLGVWVVVFVWIVYFFRLVLAIERMHRRSKKCRQWTEGRVLT